MVWFGGVVAYLCRRLGWWLAAYACVRAIFRALWEGCAGATCVCFNLDRKNKEYLVAAIFFVFMISQSMFATMIIIMLLHVSYSACLPSLLRGVVCLPLQSTPGSHHHPEPVFLRSTLLSFASRCAHQSVLVGRPHSILYPR